MKKLLKIFGFNSTAEQIEDDKRDRLVEIQAKATAYDLKNKLRQNKDNRNDLLGITVIEGRPSAIEYDATICNLVEHAWGNKSSFEQFVKEIAFNVSKLGENVILNPAMLGELFWLSDLLDQFELPNTETASVYGLTDTQKKVINLIEIPSAWDNVPTKHFDSQIL